MFSSEQLVGIIVIYNRDPRSSETLLSLHNSLLNSGGFLNLIVYDNSLHSIYQKDAVEDTYPQFKLTYIHDPTNPGVSKAYNVAASMGKEDRKSWLLLLDQDTTFPEEAISKYIEAINEHEDEVLFAPVLESSEGVCSPCRYFFKRGFPWDSVKPGIHSFRNKNILNSGTLVNLEAFSNVGGYNEKVRLYFSDFNFMDRFKRVYQNFVVIDFVCKHQLSDLTNTESEAAKVRFNHYCEGSYFSAETYSDSIFLFVTVLLRATRLSFRYKAAIFLEIFFKVYRERWQAK